MTLRNRHEGEKIIVLGSGVSILEHEPEELAGFTTIGCNQIAKWTDPNYVTFVDPPHCLYRQAGMAAPIKSMLNSECFVSREWSLRWAKAMLGLGVTKPLHPFHVFNWYRDQKEPWSNYYPQDYEDLKKYWDTRSLRLPFGPTSLGVAATIALYMGAKKIGVLGLDYHGGYFWKPKHTWLTQKRSVRITSGQWCRLTLMAKRVFDCEIVNLSKDSKINTFPYQALEDF